MTDTEYMRDAVSRQAIVLLGMHRSGTSALTGVLDQIGVTTPRTQIAAGAQNPKGFFESKPLARFNDRLLERAGHRWDSWAPVPANAISPADQESMSAEALALLDDEFGTPDLMVFKDPRLCRLVSFWEKRLVATDRTLVFLLTHRAPAEVAASLETRNGFGRSQGLLLWASYVLQAEADTRGKNRDFTSFDRLLADPLGELERIGAHCGVDYPVAPRAVAEQIDDFLDPGMRHHDELKTEDLPQPIAAIHDVFERWSAQGERAEDYDLLDRALDLLRKLAFDPDVEPQVTQDADGATADICLNAFSMLWQDRPTRMIVSSDMSQTELAAQNRMHQLVNNVLRDQLLSSRKSGQKQAEEVAQLQIATEKRDREMGTMARLLSEADAKWSVLDARLSESLITARKSSEALLALRGDTQKLREEGGWLRGKVAEFDAEIGRLSAKKEELHAVVAQVESERQALVDSTIWRASAPLRKMLNLLRGRRNR